MKIKNIPDFANFKTTTLTRVYPDEIEIKNLDDNWDGPLSGECEVSGQRKYFFCFSDNEILGVRKYLIADLDTIQKKQKALLDLKFLDLQKEKITVDEYEQFLLDNSVIINFKQIISWFLIDSSSKNSLFLKSYFKIMNL